MTPSRFLAFVRAVALTLCTLGAVALVLYALPAHAQDVPAADPITYDTACGAGGTGRYYAGRYLDETDTREPTPGLRVDANGYWAPCVMPKPPKDCPTEQAPRWFASGAWCDPVQPTIRGGDVGSVRVLIAGADATSSAPTGAKEFRCLRDSAGRARWVPIRSSCQARTAAATTPGPAAGGVTTHAPATVERPAPVVGCRPGVWSSAGRYYRHDGPVVQPGQVIVAQGLLGAAPATFLCADGRFIVPPKPAAPASSEPAADEWRRKFEQQERDSQKQ